MGRRAAGPTGIETWIQLLLHVKCKVSPDLDSSPEKLISQITFAGESSSGRQDQSIHSSRRRRGLSLEDMKQ